MRKLTTITLHSLLTAAVSVASFTAMADSGANRGADTYKLVCSSCHEVGIDGAPRLDDEVAWMHRINQGMDSLYASTLHGKCKVLVQADRKDLSDQTIKAAVDYIVSQVKQ
jgi:cytochrome c5